MTGQRRIGRRDAMGLMAGAAAVSVTGLPALAAAPLQGRARDGIQRFMLGSFEVTTLLDGIRKGDGPHPTFGADQSADTVAALLERNFLPADRSISSFTPVVVNTGSEVILFDTGLGAGARQGGLGQLQARLTEAGLAPEAIDVVVLTHMHPDHIGGLMENGTPAFPNARYVTGSTEYDFWAAPERAAGPTERVAGMVSAMVTPLADKITFLAPGGAVAPGIEAVAAAGHTPGHMAYHIESDGKRLMLTADMVNHYVLSLQRPTWHVGFDMDKDAAGATRMAVLGMIAADRIPFIGYHMPFPSVGYVEQGPDGFRWVAATVQFDL